VNGIQLLVKDNSQRLIDVNRKLRDSQHKLNHLDNVVAEILRADAIAEGVAQKLAEKTETGYRIWAVRAAVISAIAAGIGTVTELLLKVFS
jgi:uncharacterized protein YeeX (DUF496 family)